MKLYIFFSQVDKTPFILQRRNDEVEYECGISSNRMLSKRIIGGKKAYFGEFPWQAHIKIAAYQCGGVLG